MKYALVTGGSGGIGQAICQRLANAGHFVYVHANTNIDKAQAVVDEIHASGGHAQALVFDVTQYQAATEAMSTLPEDHVIQIVVNNAGIHSDAPLAGMNEEQWHKVIDVSLHGFYNVTQPLLLPMMRTRWGRIISMSSVAGVMGNRGQANYAAAKSALHGASKSLAIELASRGITVNCVAPGIITTPMTEGVFDKNLIKSIVPMQRAGSAQEVAALVDFLASEDAGYISGQVININGAMA